jgi:hypothetical protein
MFTWQPEPAPGRYCVGWALSLDGETPRPMTDWVHNGNVLEAWVFADHVLGVVKDVIGGYYRRNAVMRVSQWEERIGERGLQIFCAMVEVKPVKK